MSPHEASLDRSRRRAQAKTLRHYTVQGETLTLLELARRLGCSYDAARMRLRREQRKSGPVTWLGLQRRAPAC